MASDGELLAVVEDLYERGRTDICGGVHPETVANELGRSRSDVYRRLAALDQAGELEAVYGLHPREKTVRTSYLPPEYVE